MAETFRYLSEEWAGEALRRLTAELDAEKMNKVTTSMTNIYNGCPDGRTRFLFVQVVDGAITRVETGDGEVPKAEFVISGDYETFARISRAELGSQRALMTGKLKVKGNMARALKLAAVADRFNKVLSRIPTDY